MPQNGHGLRSGVGQGAELSGFWPPMGCTHLRGAGQRGRAPGPVLSPSRPPCRPGQPSHFLPKSRFLPASTGAGSGSGWGGTIGGCGGREMPKVGEGEGEHKQLSHPAAVLVPGHGGVGSTRRQQSGGHQRLMNLISQNKFPFSFATFRGRQMKKKRALSLRIPSVGTRGSSPRSPKHFKCQFDASQVHQVCMVLPVSQFSCIPPPRGTPATQGCHHQTGSTFSLLVSSAPRALQGAPAPTLGAPGPGSLGRPLSALHPKPISHEVLGRDSVMCPQTGGFSQKILPWQRGNARAWASSPCLGDIAAGELGTGGSPLFRPPDARCTLGRARVAVHVLLHARGPCQGVWAPCSYTLVCTHSHWVCRVCAPRVCAHAPSTLICFVLALSTCTTHTLCTHSTRTLCTPTAGSTCALWSTAGSLLCTLSTLSCLPCAHSFHTHHAQSVCALCKPCTHPLCSHSPQAVCMSCPTQMLCVCSLHMRHAPSAQVLSV